MLNVRQLSSLKRDVKLIADHSVIKNKHQRQPKTSDDLQAATNF